MVGGQVAGLVHPVLEQLSVARRVVDQGPRVGTQPCEEWELLAADEDVDRVDLDQPDPVEHTPEVTAVDSPGRARIGETLGAEREPPRPDGRQ